VKANYVGENATVVKDKWGFTLANYDKRPGVVCRDSFAFPKHCEQVFYCEAREAPGGKVVLRKAVRGKRVLPEHEEDTKTLLFNMGDDEDFESLRPERNVGEGSVDAVPIGHDVVMQEVLVRGRGGQRNRGRDRGRSIGRGFQTGRGARGGRGRGRAGRPSVQLAESSNMAAPIFANEEDQNEEELLYRENLGSDGLNRGRSREEDGLEGARRNRRRSEVEENVGTTQYTVSSDGIDSNSLGRSLSSSDEQWNDNE